MSGSVARAIAQIAMFGFNVFIKAFSQAYQQAKAGGGPVSSGASAALGKMALDQAKQVLQVEFRTGAAVPRDEVMKQFEKYYAANDPEKGGSFYLQSKIWNAKEVLLEEAKRQEAAEAAAKASQSKGSSGAGSSRGGQAFHPLSSRALGAGNGAEAVFSSGLLRQYKLRSGAWSELESTGAARDPLRM